MNKEQNMNDYEKTPEPKPIALFGVDNDPARVHRLERQIGHLRAELVAVRRALQQQRLRADEAEAKLAEQREGDR